MGGKQQAYAALLRGINVSGRRLVPMAELRSLLADIGCNGVRTYIQSGNVVFTSAGASAGLERQLEQAIEQEFGFFVPVVVRAASALQRRASAGERVKKRGDAIWIHYVKGIARSKLTPAVLDKEIGSPATARNWRTVLRIHEMLQSA